MCLYCGKINKIKKNCRNKFCTNKCQANYKWVNIDKKKVEQGLCNYRKVGVKSSIVRYLKERDGLKCSICNLYEWCGDKIPLDIDHIDGDFRNNFPDNLRFLCPNCHRQTPTWGNKIRFVPV